MAAATAHRVTAALVPLPLVCTLIPAATAHASMRMRAMTTDCCMSAHARQSRDAVGRAAQTSAALKGAETHAVREGTTESGTQRIAPDVRRPHARRCAAWGHSGSRYPPGDPAAALAHQHMPTNQELRLNGTARCGTAPTCTEMHGVVETGILTLDQHSVTQQLFIAALWTTAAGALRALQRQQIIAACGLDTG